MQRSLSLILIFGFCSWLWLGQFNVSWAAAVNGATSPLEAPTPSPASLNSSNIPSEKVSQFVAACLRVVALIERREGELQGAETESESLRIQQDIEAEAIAIIAATGLTRPEYLQLLGLANVDPEFGERIATLLQEGAA
jgi:hypothetical protein